MVETQANRIARFRAAYLAAPDDKPKQAPKPSPQARRLQREIAILRAVMNDESTAAIGKRLHLSSSAVGMTMYRMRKRYGLANNLQLVYKLSREGVL